MTDPAAPLPDAKDWTWVLERPCPDCGFDPAGVERTDVGARTLAYVDTLATSALAPGGDVRPAPAVWSAVEYACHVRDVCALFESRLRLMLDVDDPVFDNWDQDETALEQRYWEQPAAAVVPELTAAAASVAARWDAVRAEQWTRPGRRSNGSVFTVETFARYFLHDLAHHAWDVTG